MDSQEVTDSMACCQIITAQLVNKPYLLTVISKLDVIANYNLWTGTLANLKSLSRAFKAKTNPHRVYLTISEMHMKYDTIIQSSWEQKIQEKSISKAFACSWHTSRTTMASYPKWPRGWVLRTIMGTYRILEGTKVNVENDSSVDQCTKSIITLGDCF